MQIGDLVTTKHAINRGLEKLPVGIVLRTNMSKSCRYVPVQWPWGRDDVPMDTLEVISKCTK